MAKDKPQEAKKDNDGRSIRDRADTKDSELPERSGKMANEKGGPTVEEKGKGKAVDKSTDGDKKSTEVKKDKDGADAKDMEHPEGWWKRASCDSCGC